MVAPIRPKTVGELQAEIKQLRAAIAPRSNRGRNPHIYQSDDETEPMPGTPEHEAWLRKKLQGSGLGLG